MKDYALYKGDTLIMIGTVREIATKRGIKESSVYSYAKPSYKKRIKGNEALALVCLDNDDEANV